MYPQYNILEYKLEWGMDCLPPAGRCHFAHIRLNEFYKHFVDSSQSLPNRSPGFQDRFFSSPFGLIILGGGSGPSGAVLTRYPHPPPHPHPHPQSARLTDNCSYTHITEKNPTTHVVLLYVSDTMASVVLHIWSYMFLILIHIMTYIIHIDIGTRLVHSAG